MLGGWASWIQMAASTQASSDDGRPWWATADSPASDTLAGGVKQLQETLSKDPTLRSIDQMWNANPLAQSRSDRLGGNRPSFAYSLAPVACEAGSRQDDHGPQPEPLALSVGILAGRGTALDGDPGIRSRKDRLPPRPTNGSPHPNGRQTLPTAS